MKSQKEQTLATQFKQLLSALVFMILAVFGVTSSYAVEQTSGATNVEVAEFGVQTVNINTASANELSAALNGVGEKKALEIVAFREANGRFAAPIELVEVKGIGESTFEKNKSRIVVE